MISKFCVNPYSGNFTAGIYVCGSFYVKILLLICAAFTSIICVYLGYGWNEIQDEIVSKMAKAFPAIMILITVGLMISA